jgi:tetratricopeptide (TPR) repeat protein
VDLRPTIEDLLGIPSSEPVDGHSLVKDDTNPGRAVYMETLFGFLGAGWSPLYGLRRHREKYVLAPKPEYYDLREDPDEEVNLLPERDEQAAPLRSELTSLLAAWKSTPGPTHAVRGMSPQEIARLSSLGYVHAELTDPSGDLPDPKDMLPAFNSVLEAMALHGRGRSGEAVAMLREALEANEEMIPAYRMLAEVYRDLGRHEQAIDVLRRAETIRAEVSTLILLAEMVLQVGRFDPAAEILDRAEALAPDDGRVPLLRGDSLARQGRYGEAVEQYQKALEKDENRVGLPAREAIIEAQKHLGLSSPGSF